MQNVTCRGFHVFSLTNLSVQLEDNDLRYFSGATITLPANYQMNDNSSIASKLQEDMTNSSPMDISVDENSSHHSSSSMCCFTIPEDMSFFSSDYLLHTSLNTTDVYEHQMTASGSMIYGDTNSELDSMSFGENFSLNNISFITHSKGK
ncbi:unnamed protein product [Brugia pahangi]|uniref:C2 tensin-type domain-containing protein n=1 Tax=Brugia pahangi TaxID=6280 RepID=A0A0N4TK48_BRUPA|nr:unnamed protein product [Brugia pahangi]